MIEMFCGFWRAPARMAVLPCVLVCLFAGSAGPARAYACAPDSTHTSVATQNHCDQPRPAPVWRKKGDADAMSFVFFLGAVCAVLLIPLAFGKREELPPQ